MVVDGLRFLLRALAGRDLDGGQRTNARWARPGTTTKGERDHASRWAHYPHRKRAGVRMMLLLILAVLTYGAVTDALSTVIVLRLLFWTGLAAALWAGWEWSRRYGHRREVLAPLSEALASHLHDDRYVLDPRTHIRVPVDVHDKATRIHLPRDYAPSDPQEKALVRLIARKVGLVAPSHTLELRGTEPYVEVRPAPAPREVVGFSQLDVRAAVDNCPEGQLFLGFGPRNVPAYVDLEAESPHVAFSMATGAGKSVAGRALQMQMLRQGGNALVLDRKIESQLWSISHPGVRYACSEKEIFDALMDVSGEIDRRFELVRERRFAGQVIDREEIGPRLLIIAEELNALEIDLRIWWRTVREQGDPAQCPALPILGRILAMGRAGRVHMIVIAQKLTCQAIGGPAARENLSTRVLGRATTSTWNMLAPECKVGGKYPRGSRHRGRVHVVIGDEATPVQVMFAGEDDALAYAMGGAVNPFPVMGGGSPRDAVTSGNAGGYPHLALVSDPEDAPATTTLSDFEAASGIALRSLRRARERDARFPEAVESAPGQPSLYRVSDLEAWADARAMATAGGDAS